EPGEVGEHHGDHAPLALAALPVRAFGRDRRHPGAALETELGSRGIALTTRGTGCGEQAAALNTALRSARVLRPTLIALHDRHTPRRRSTSVPREKGRGLGPTASHFTRRWHHAR